jgi:hypothetical protein
MSVSNLRFISIYASLRPQGQDRAIVRGCEHGALTTLMAT